MSNISDFNFIALTSEHLKHELHDAIHSEIMRKLIDEFKEMAEPVVKEQVKKVTLGTIRSYTDLAKIRDEVVVHLKWDEE